MPATIADRPKGSTIRASGAPSGLIPVYHFSRGGREGRAFRKIPDDSTPSPQSVPPRPRRHHPDVELGAALIIQRAALSWLYSPLRQVIASYYNAKHAHVYNSAATKIQKVWRGVLVRSSLEKRVRRLTSRLQQRLELAALAPFFSALLLPRRGFHRTLDADAVGIWELGVYTAAAKRLQAAWRGHRVRKLLREGGPRAVRIFLGLQPTPLSFEALTVRMMEGLPVDPPTRPASADVSASVPLVFCLIKEEEASRACIAIEQDAARSAIGATFRLDQQRVETVVSLRIMQEQADAAMAATVAASMLSSENGVLQATRAFSLLEGQEDDHRAAIYRAEWKARAQLQSKAVLEQMDLAEGQPSPTTATHDSVAPQGVPQPPSSVHDSQPMTEQRASDAVPATDSPSNAPLPGAERSAPPSRGSTHDDRDRADVAVVVRQNPDRSDVMSYSTSGLSNFNNWVLIAAAEQDGATLLKSNVLYWSDDGTWACYFVGGSISVARRGKESAPRWTSSAPGSAYEDVEEFECVLRSGSIAVTAPTEEVMWSSGALQESEPYQGSYLLILSNNGDMCLVERDTGRTRWSISQRRFRFRTGMPPKQCLCTESMVGQRALKMKLITELILQEADERPAVLMEEMQDFSGLVNAHAWQWHTLNAAQSVKYSGELHAAATKFTTARVALQEEESSTRVQLILTEGFDWDMLLTDALNDRPRPPSITEQFLHSPTPSFSPENDLPNVTPLLQPDPGLLGPSFLGTSNILAQSLLGLLESSSNNISNSFGTLLQRAVSSPTTTTVDFPEIPMITSAKHMVLSIAHIPLPPDSLWDIVGRLDSTWYPSWLSVELSDPGVRVVRLENGGTRRHKEFFRSDETYSYAYSCSEPHEFPVQNLSFVLRIDPLEDGFSKFYFVAEFDLVPGIQLQHATLLMQTYVDVGVRHLEEEQKSAAVSAGPVARNSPETSAEADPSAEPVHEEPIFDEITDLDRAAQQRRHAKEAEEAAALFLQRCTTFDESAFEYFMAAFKSELATLVGEVSASLELHHHATCLQIYYDWLSDVTTASVETRKAIALLRRAASVATSTSAQPSRVLHVSSVDDSVIVQQFVRARLSEFRRADIVDLSLLRGTSRALSVRNYRVLWTDQHSARVHIERVERWEKEMLLSLCGFGEKNFDEKHTGAQPPPYNPYPPDVSPTRTLRKAPPNLPVIPSTHMHGALKYAAPAETPVAHRSTADYSSNLPPISRALTTDAAAADVKDAAPVSLPAIPLHSQRISHVSVPQDYAADDVDDIALTDLSPEEERLMANLSSIYQRIERSTASYAAKSEAGPTSRSSEPAAAPSVTLSSIGSGSTRAPYLQQTLGPLNRTAATDPRGFVPSISGGVAPANISASVPRVPKSIVIK